MCLLGGGVFPASLLAVVLLTKNYHNQKERQNDPNKSETKLSWFNCLQLGNEISWIYSNVQKTTAHVASKNSIIVQVKCLHLII